MLRFEKLWRGASLSNESRRCKASKPTADWRDKSSGGRVSVFFGLAITSAFLVTPTAFAEDSFLGTDAVSFSGSVEIEGTFFAEDPRFEGQDNNAVSSAVRSRLVLDWDSTNFGADSASVTLAPFFRFDPQDDERTRGDLREAKLDLRFGDTDITIGNDFIFWGKTEVDQIVDIINQTDGVEGTDGEDKLGQPMVRVSRIVDIGEFSGEASIFYLPFFRERTFLGAESRLRGGALIDEDAVVFETSQEEWTPSFAARLAGFYGDFDIGFSAFHGLSRDPAFEINPASFDPTTGAFELRPVYGRITQVGFDGQFTSDATLWKAEIIGRFDQRNLSFEEEDYISAIAGVEHTLFGVVESNADLGLIAEYAYDSRGDDALTPFENDVVLGARLALNDTQDTSALFTATIDTETAETLLRIEGERRIGEIAKLSVEAGAFLNTDEDSVADDLQDDHFLRATLAVFW